MRGRESELFLDPYATKLAGDGKAECIWPQRDAAQLLELQRWVALRTRWIDDALAMEVGAGVRQLVIVGAGFDCRALRLETLRIPEMVVYEMDHPEVFEAKMRRIAGCGDGSSARCVRIATDLSLGSDSWSAALLDAGFEPSKSSVWLAEGVVAYLTEPHVDDLLTGIGRLTQPAAALGAVAVPSVADDRLTHAPSIVVTWPGLDRRLVNDIHRFATDLPEAKLAETGLAPSTRAVRCESIGQVAERYGRGKWFAPEDRTLLLTHTSIPAW
jgi:methyltransferase (TIGR00027 family)